LIDKYYAIPPVVKTKVDMDADGAIARAQSLKAWLDQLTSKTIVVTVQTNAVGAPAGVGTGATNTTKKFADGGTVLGPGGPKSDQVQAWLSAGEEVTPQPQASKFRPVLKALSRDDVAGARHALGAGGSAVLAAQAPVNVHITSNGVDLSKYIDVRVEQGGKQLFAQAAQEMQGGLV